MPKRIITLGLILVVLALPLASLARLLSPHPCRSPLILPMIGNTMPHPVPDFSAIIAELS